jgi:hypothetical protein
MNSARTEGVGRIMIGEELFNRLQVGRMRAPNSLATVRRADRGGRESADIFDSVTTDFSGDTDQARPSPRRALPNIVQEGTNAMVMRPAGLLPTLTVPAIETAALRRDVTVTRHVAVRHRGVTVRGRHVAVRHRGVTRTRHVAAGHRGVAVRTRHVAIRHRAVAARRTHVAVVRRGAVAVKSTAVVRPVRPWVQQPYYGAVFDGVTLGAVIAANAVPTSPSNDLCWYWSNSSKSRG